MAEKAPPHWKLKLANTFQIIGLLGINASGLGVTGNKSGSYQENGGSQNTCNPVAFPEIEVHVGNATKADSLIMAGCNLMLVNNSRLFRANFDTKGTQEYIEKNWNRKFQDPGVEACARQMHDLVKHNDPQDSVVKDEKAYLASCEEFGIDAQATALFLNQYGGRGSKIDWKRLAYRYPKPIAAIVLGGLSVLGLWGLSRRKKGKYEEKESTKTRLEKDEEAYQAYLDREYRGPLAENRADSDPSTVRASLIGNNKLAVINRGLGGKHDVILTDQEGNGGIFLVDEGMPAAVDGPKFDSHHVSRQVKAVRENLETGGQSREAKIRHKAAYDANLRPDDQKKIGRDFYLARSDD